MLQSDPCHRWNKQKAVSFQMYWKTVLPTSGSAWDQSLRFTSWGNRVRETPWLLEALLFYFAAP